MVYGLTFFLGGYLTKYFIKKKLPWTIQLLFLSQSEHPLTDDEIQIQN